MSTYKQTVASQPPAAAGKALRLEVHPVSHWPGIAPVWEELFQRSRSNSIFLSRGWTEAWLETFGRALNVSVLVFEALEGPAGVCLAVGSRALRAMIPMRRLSLNASGEDYRETTYIEYNGVLSPPGWEEAIATKLAEHVIGQQWDEFTLDGFPSGPVYDSLRLALREYHLEEDTRPCYCVDLDYLRRTGIRYETVLRSRYRNTLRRNIKAYSALGPLRLEEAADTGQAIEMFEELTRLNRRRWAALRRRTPFDAPRFLLFHRSLIRSCFAGGAIQILRLATGDHTVGILYNLICGGKVHAYQCGYDYEPDSHRSPGLITHAYAIQHCIDRGLDDWDFLSGESRFKHSLSTGSRRLTWATFRKPSLKVGLLNAARAARRGLRGLDWLAGRGPTGNGDE